MLSELRYHRDIPVISLRYRFPSALAAPVRVCTPLYSVSLQLLSEVDDFFTLESWSEEASDR